MARGSSGRSSPSLRIAALTTGLAMAVASVGPVGAGQSGGEGERRVVARDGATSWVFEVRTDENEPVERRLRRISGGDIVFRPHQGGVFPLPHGERGYLGVHALEVTPEFRRHLGGGGESGVLVSRVVEGSPAERAGIEVGDLLTGVDGEPLEASWDLKRQIASRGTGDVVRLDLVRDRRKRSLEATLETRPSLTLDLAPLIRTDQEGRTVLIAPMVRGSGSDSGGGGIEWRFGPHVDTTRHLDRAYEEAVEALSDPELNVVVGEELETRRELEQRIEELEARLREIESRLEAETDPD